MYKEAIHVFMQVTAQNKRYSSLKLSQWNLPLNKLLWVFQLKTSVKNKTIYKIPNNWKNEGNVQSKPLKESLDAHFPQVDMII